MTQDNDARKAEAEAKAAGRKPTAKVLEHSYDGIQEYDNPMPRWWLLTFAGTIIFCVIYLFNVGPIGNGKGQIADYEAELKAFAIAHPPTESGAVSAEALLALTKDPAALALGKTTFAANCAACHRADGGGVIGPNLADNAWLHGGTIVEIYHTIAAGVLEKGMPPWVKMLKPDQLQAVTAYVVTLRETHPSNPKAPQGVVITP